MTNTDILIGIREDIKEIKNSTKKILEKLEYLSGKINNKTVGTEDNDRWKY